MRTNIIKRRSSWLFGAFLLTCVFFTSAAHAANWRLAVPPFLPQAEMNTQYTPLLDFLNATTGEHFELITSSNYLSYWNTALKSGSYDLVIDNAPMIDFRVQRQKFTVLAKIPGVISQSVVTDEKTNIFEIDELVGKKVAAVASPNLSALAMFQLFPNPMRQPDYVYANDSRAAVEMVLQNKALAAIVPTPIAIQFTNLNLVTNTEQTPHLAVAAAPSLPPEVQNKVKQALLNASKTALGQKALTALNTAGFEPASNADYSGYAKWLDGVVTRFSAKALNIEFEWPQRKRTNSLHNGSQFLATA